MSLSVTAKQKLIVNAQKRMWKESRQNKQESHQTAAEERQGRRKKQEQLGKQTSLPSQPPGKQTDSKCTQNARDCFILFIYFFSDYFKCKWANFSNQKIEWLSEEKTEKEKKKKTHTRPIYVLFIRDSLQK